MNYLSRIWESRYFWTHLALADLRSRWRRSFFGLLWSVLQPLGLTLLLSVVFGKIFRTDITDYAPYILSGMVLWDFLSSCASGGSLCFVQADAYIKQHSHPLAIYSLRAILTNLMVLGMASLALVAWVLAAEPSHFGWAWLAALTVYPLAALMAWPLATLLAYAGARFRDLPHALTLLLQALWFISPVYIQESVFRQSGLGPLVDDNPLYHLLQVLRAPLLQGRWPTAADYAWCLATAALLGLAAWGVGRRAEPKVIFYL